MRYWLTMLCLLFVVPALAQVRFLFVPELYGRSIDGLYNTRLINPSGRTNGTLTITVTERKSGAVFSVNTASFEVPPGTSIIPPQAVRNARIQFFNTRISAITRQQRYFPQGLYEYCFTLATNGATTAPLSEECFEFELTPFAELNLLSPYDKDKVCELRPMLTWQPLLPAVTGAAYQLVLAEIRENQNAVEALNYNLPIINQSSIIANMLPYPPVAPELVKGKRYAWQVTAFKDQTVLNRSEIWEFTVGCDEPEAKAIANDGYRNIEDLARGNYYIADGALKLVINNSYTAQKLKYEILSLRYPGRKIKGLPGIKLENGRNKVLIDLRNAKGLEDAQYYQFSVWLPNGEMKSLRFLFYANK